MITIYEIKDFDGVDLGYHVDHDAALRHVKHARSYSREGEDDIQIVLTQVESLAHQPIYASGEVLGHQFRMDGYGGRTFWRHVRNLRVSQQGSIVGNACTMGREILVEYDAQAWVSSRIDSNACWRAIEITGWR